MLLQDKFLHNEQFVGKDTKDILREAFGKKKKSHSRTDDSFLSVKQYQQVWQEKINQKVTGQDRSAYIHIPFCRLRCLYCGFFKNFKELTRQERYVKSLLEDIKMSGQADYCHAQPLKAVYFGGGTPGVLSPAEITEILTALRENLTLAPDCEITFETALCDLNDDQLDACLAGGVNRFSLGVQTFDTKIRQLLGRPDDEKTIRNRLEELATKQKQAAIIIDLIYGLPGQTHEKWQYDLDVAIGSSIHGLDTYALNLLPSSILAEQILAGKIEPVANRSQQADFFVQAVETLSNKGMRRLSVCHWGRFDLMERNVYNKLGKGNAGRIPFGAGAGGNIDGYRVRLEPDVDRYEELIKEGKKPLKVVAMPSEHQYIFGQIKDGLDQGYVFLDGLDGYIKDILEPLLAVWEQKGFINRARSVNELTIAGQFWYVELTQAMLDFLQIHLSKEQKIV